MEEKNLHDESIEEVCHEHEHDHEHEHHHDHEHEHHHDHEHEHHHDHEHEHHHDHEHEHHHDHEHEHDHHHHHDHDHEHEHGHQYDVPGFRVFETHNHEGATICSFEKDVQKDPAIVIQNMEAAIKTLEAWLDENDAVIGHVKGYVKEAGPVTTFSTVGCGLNVEKRDGSTVCVGFASIVFGPSEEVLKDHVAQIFASL